MLFFAGRSAEGAAILRRAQERLPAGGAGTRAARGRAARPQLHLGVGAARGGRRDRRAARPGRPGTRVLQATTLATLAMDEVLYLRLGVRRRSTSRERALAAGLPAEPHRGENWAILALGALGAADGLDAALRGIDEILARGARARRGTDGRDHVVRCER